MKALGFLLFKDFFSMSFLTYLNDDVYGGGVMVENMHHVPLSLMVEHVNHSGKS